MQIDPTFTMALPEFAATIVAHQLFEAINSTLIGGAVV
jgi:hypothetical protein